ncbi:GspE/PulE family protein [Arcobacter sp. FWKO B]|uniref:GspE/PulE family protein n=1 Tax=Arcobacter sp. FWKO B TaxID=2593672 RepID=UPI0018A66FED|nr:GspE/PulE family protein [Arcobacter sp. FWKO B]QOG11630.1 type II secretion system protein E [Arcobacter sp. FWKO B]
MPHKDHKKIGELLQGLGFITAKQIEVALKAQIASTKFFGEILEDLDFVTSEEVAQALASQYQVEYINLSTIIPSKEALKAIEEDFALSKSILPFKVEDDFIYVATWDPNDLGVEDLIVRTTGKKVKFFMSPKSTIAYYVQLYYYQLSNPLEDKIINIIKSVLNGENANIVELLDLFIKNGIKDRATDIHISPEEELSHVFFRIDGVLKHYYSYPISMHQEIISRVKILSSLNIAELRLPQDGGMVYDFLGKHYDLRISTLPTYSGENLVVRILSQSGILFNISSLGFSDDIGSRIERIFQKPYGLVLVVGPTGSGKTTTLYSALRKINSLEKNVLTIEDPIEYRFAFIRQTQVNEKAGYSYANALKTFMRQDPDVILLGEIRDSDTAQLALRASVTGHLVLSTLHTNDAPSTIARLHDLGVQSFMIASSLLGIIAQRLIRKLCDECKNEVVIDKSELLKYKYKKEDIDTIPTDKVTIYEKVGCPSCNHRGYLGRSVIVEFLEVDDEIKEMIVKGNTTYDIEKVALSKGMTSFKTDGLRRVLEGITTLEEIDRVII